MKHTLLAAALLSSAIFAPYTAAQAASISGLHNTGLGAAGDSDSHYTLKAQSSDTWIPATKPVITIDNVWPISPWMANSNTSKWITPTANQGQSFDGWDTGYYTYSLSFDLSGYNAATAAFSGRVAADNFVTVLLNNHVVGTGNGFSDWSSFSSGAGGSAFVSGVNKLDFVVTNWAQNGGNPTGLRVEFDASSVAAVPEPETYALMLGGLALVGAVARRRKLA